MGNLRGADASSAMPRHITTVTVGHSRDLLRSSMRAASGSAIEQ